MQDRAYPTLGAATRIWARIGLLSFGGPAGQIALMHRILVEEQRWLGEKRFLHALNYCMLLPGPEAMQLAVYIGWLMHRTLGGIIAGVLFVLPGVVAIMALSWVYALYGNVGPVEALFFGLKAAVLAIVVQAVIRIGSRALKNGAMVTIAAAAFILLPITPASVVIFSLVMGALWLATVPLTSGLVAYIYGLRYMGTLYGFVFLSHQLGSFLGVWLGGRLYDAYGDYTLVWWIGVGVGAFSALIHLPVREAPARLAAA